MPIAVIEFPLRSWVSVDLLSLSPLCLSACAWLMNFLSDLECLLICWICHHCVFLFLAYESACGGFGVSSQLLGVSWTVESIPNMFFCFCHMRILVMMVDEFPLSSGASVDLVSLSLLCLSSLSVIRKCLWMVDGFLLGSCWSVESVTSMFEFCYCHRPVLADGWWVSSGISNVSHYNSWLAWYTWNILERAIKLKKKRRNLF